MKKIIYTTLISLTLSVTGLLAQSNLTWIIKDPTQKGFLKTATVFNSTFSGFKSNEETASFIQTLKSNKEIATCDVLSSSKNSCDLKIVMKQAHNKPYYINLASTIGVQFISLNGNKKTLQELREAQKK